jgi:poly(3-hydroxybutyrate) depolymerase
MDAAGGEAGETGTGAGGTPAGGGGEVGVTAGLGGGGAGGGPSRGGSGGLGFGGSGGSAGASGAAGNGASAGSTQSPGCGSAPTLTSGSSTIQSGGQSRSYILQIPDDYDSTRPYLLVFAYHWRGGTMQDVDGGGTSGAAWSYYGLRDQADDSTIFVAPQGIGNGWPNSGGQDLTFTDDMMALIADDLCVDLTQVFALGFSYGGGMSYSLACARPDVFRAVAVYSGGVLSGCEGGTEPVAYIGIHGLGDGTLNISGGRSMRDRFVMANGCTAQDPPEPSAGSLTHTCTTYQGCTEGYPVEWCAFDGGHTPGVVDGGGDDGARTWTKTQVWQFFTQFE